MDKSTLPASICADHNRFGNTTKVNAAASRLGPCSDALRQAKLTKLTGLARASCASAQERSRMRCCFCILARATLLDSAACAALQKACEMQALRTLLSGTAGEHVAPGEQAREEKPLAQKQQPQLRLSDCQTGPILHSGPLSASALARRKQLQQPSEKLRSK